MVTKRPGLTEITSVSVSKEFRDILERYKFSPTEVFRKGIGVSLYDEGIFRYQSDTNKKRSEFLKKFLFELTNNTKKLDLFDKMVGLANEILEIKKEIENLNEN